MDFILSLVIWTIFVNEINISISDDNDNLELTPIRTYRRNSTDETDSEIEEQETKKYFSDKTKKRMGYVTHYIFFGACIIGFQYLFFQHIVLNYDPLSISEVKYLIFHYTGMKSENAAIKRLTNESTKVSCHYFIKKNGEIILMVPEKYEAWHAGISAWKKDVYLNKSSIGIEISNKGHRFGYENYSKNQINSLFEHIL